MNNAYFSYSSDSTNYGIWSSTDSATWTKIFNSGCINNMYYRNGYYFACGYNISLSSDYCGVWRSSDLVTWEHILIGPYINTLYIDDSTNTIVAYGSNSSNDYSGLYTSLDNGDSWSTITQKIDIANSNGYIQYFADKGIYLSGSSSSSGITYSLNGTDWKKTNLTTGSFYNYIIYASTMNVFIATGSSKQYIYYSTDGITWTSVSLNSRSFYTNCVNYFADKNIYIAGTTNSGTEKGLYYSTDGTTWTSAVSNVYAYNNDEIDSKLYIFGGDFGYYVTENGKNYESGLAGKYISNMFCINDTYYATSFTTSTTTNGIYRSTDKGTTWTQVLSNVSINGIYYGNGIYFGYGIGLYTSTDGITWTLYTDTSITASSVIKNFKYINGTYFVYVEISRGVYIYTITVGTTEKTVVADIETIKSETDDVGTIQKTFTESEINSYLSILG